MKLAGKTAIVTGSASGIGAAQAIELAKEGAQVVLTDRNEKGLIATKEKIEALGGQAIYYVCDVTDSAALEKMYQTAMDKWGKIDILCNTHGKFDQRKGSLETTEEDFKELMQVNCVSVFVLCNLVLPQMVERGEGCIITVASVSGIRNTAIGGPKGSAGGGAGYTASKHAVVGYMKNLTGLYAWRGIRANTICPGSVITPLIQDSLDNEPDGYERRARVIPAGRLGTPEDVAKITAFLASDDAKFIHGATITVDGGRSIV